MYFIARLWPHLLYFSCIFSIIWPNLRQGDLDGKILHLQNSRRSLSQNMPHSMMLRFFAASSSSNSTPLTSTLSQNHGPSSGSSTNLKNVKFGQCLSETQCTQTLMDGRGASAANCHGSVIYGDGEGGGVAGGERVCVTEAVVVAAGRRRCPLHRRSHQFSQRKVPWSSDHAQGRASVAAFQPGFIAA